MKLIYWGKDNAYEADKYARPFEERILKGDPTVDILTYNKNNPYEIARRKRLSDHEYEFSPYPDPMEVGSDRLKRYLELTADTPGMEFLFNEVKLTAIEQKEVALFSVKGVKQMPFDNDALDERIEYITNEQFANPNDPYPIVIPKKFIVKSLNIKTNRFVFYGTWINACAMNKTVATYLQESGLRGFDLLPVEKRKGQCVDNHFFLHIPNLMPPAFQDCTREEGIEDECKYLGIKGCASYTKEAVEQALDFNYSREAVGPTYCMGEIVVSKQFVELYKEKKLRDMKIQPIFTIGSDLYNEYIEQYMAFEKMIKEYHPNNKIVVL
ncbi:hypothetical protein [Sulfurovum sp.]|uniref:hypothetical protein n=1 Tax=Sulfurovum sp. TaxID=1969726 RepID=UPI0035639E76